jgi:hypothetical protein
VDPDRARLIAAVWRDRRAAVAADVAPDAVWLLRDVLVDLVPDTPDLVVAQLGEGAPEVLAVCDGHELYRVGVDETGAATVDRLALATARVKVLAREADDGEPVRRWTVTCADGEALVFETHGSEAGPEGIDDAFARRLVGRA